MKIQISKSDLQDAIKAVIKIIPTKAVVSDIENVCIAGKDGIVTVAGTDLTTYVKYTIDGRCYFDGSFEFLIDAAKLDKIASLCDNFVEIELMSDKVKINTAQGNFTLPIYNSDSFPVKNNDGSKIADFNAKHQILHHIKKAVQFAGTDDLRPNICGVNLVVNDNKCSVQSTNLHICYKHDTECVSKENLEVVIPTKTCKILSQLDNDNFVLYQLSSLEYRIQIGNIDVYFYTVEVKFPAVNSIIPAFHSHINVFSFKKSELLKTMQAVLITANNATNSIEFHVSNDSAMLKSIDYDMCMECELEAKCSIEKKTDDVFSFAVNGKFMIDVVNSLNIPNSNDVTMYMREAKQAILFYTDDDSTILLIMPIVINKVN